MTQDVKAVPAQEPWVMPETRILINLHEHQGEKAQKVGHWSVTKRGSEPGFNSQTGHP